VFFWLLSSNGVIGAGDFMEYEGHCLRHELKYHLTSMQYRILRRKFGAVLKPDSHAGPDGRYHIRSIYFDDFRNTAYFDKMAGVPMRKKYRMRIYNCSDDFIKFERKNKFGEYVCKESVVLSREEADRIIGGDVSFLTNCDNQLLRCFRLDCCRNMLHPVALVDYLREAYVHPVGNVRITFDIGVHTGLGPISFFDRCTPTVKAYEEPGVILEVKFDDVLPAVVRGLFSDDIRPRSAIGKFGMCRCSAGVLVPCALCNSEE
jgi:hypothetical protein